MRGNIGVVVLAAIAMLAACETVEPQSPEGTEGLMIAEIVSDTKTYLEPDKKSEIYKTRWSKGDYIYLIDATRPNMYPERCYLVQGEGTSTGYFTVPFESSSYYAMFYPSYHFFEGQGFCGLPFEQYYYGLYSNGNETDDKVFLKRAYPMAAKSSTKKLKFYNLCSILKFSVTGHGEYLQHIVVRSNDNELLSGSALVDFNSERPMLTLNSMSFNSGRPELLYKVEQNLTSDPLDCYIVLPSQVYDKGFTIELHTDKSWMEVITKENIILGQSEMFQIKEPIQYVPERDIWAVETRFENYDKYDMTYDNGWYKVSNHDIQNFLRFRNMRTGGYLSLSPEYGVDYYAMDTCQNLASESECSTVKITTHMDIYMNPDTRTAYLLGPGADLNSLPTLEHIYEVDFSSLWNVEDNRNIMVSGTVVANCEKGFILAMGYKGGNNVFVHNLSSQLDNPSVGTLVDVYARKTTERGLPELIITDDSWMYVWFWYNESVDNYQYDLMTSEDLASYVGGGYDYIRYRGKLVNEGGVYYVNVDSLADLRGMIFHASESLEEYVGKDVKVDGFFLGFTSDHSLCTMITDIDFSEGSETGTEDFFLGEDIKM